jgi:putative tryptophan/tyrosine transport system substrate-binding protein
MWRGGRPVRGVARFALIVVALAILGVWPGAAAETPARIPRVGVVIQGGPYQAAVDGLRDGLKDVGLHEGQHLTLVVRDGHGDLKAVEAAARELERDGVNLIVSVATSVSLAVKKATTTVPIVFAVGSDPVAAGLVDSFAKPGGRLTGFHSLRTDTTGKRLEVLRELLPGGRRVLTFYSPGNRTARGSVTMSVEASQHLGWSFVAREVSTVEELRKAVRGLRRGEADAFFFVSDAMVNSQADLIIETANAIKLPTMAYPELVTSGALAGYGVSYRDVARHAATYVRRLLAGEHARDLPVEAVSRLSLVFNVKTAKILGVTIPQSLLLRADELVE